jgi:hypothetical protein
MHTGLALPVADPGGCVSRGGVPFPVYLSRTMYEAPVTGHSG